MTPNKLKTFREKMKMTQKELGEALEISSKRVSRHETGQAIPKHIEYACYYLAIKRLTIEQRRELAALK